MDAFEIMMSIYLHYSTRIYDDIFEIYRISEFLLFVNGIVRTFEEIWVV